jgi:Protein of unknown function (DUF3307)
MDPLSLLLLYALFRAKHFVCDFLLQTDWMALTKGKPGAEGYRALFIHAGIHAIGTLLITVFFAPALWWLGPLDFVVHSIVDRIKGYFTYKKGWTPKDTIFWWTLGADQEAHNFTHLAYIVLIWMHLGATL